MKENRLIATIGNLMRPLPLFPLQAMLDRIVTGVASKRPELFPRLGQHTQTRYLIDVSELPFLLLLTPDPAAPRLGAFRRNDEPTARVRIRGAFLDLFKVLDGRGDSDALFFNREIEVTGDTEAAVCLRNALDDLEGSAAEDVAETVGPFAPVLRAALDRLRRME